MQPVPETDTESIEHLDEAWVCDVQWVSDGAKPCGRPARYHSEVHPEAHLWSPHRICEPCLRRILDPDRCTECNRCGKLTGGERIRNLVQL